MVSIEYTIGDCLELMKELDDNSIDSIITDPPYGISFMGKKWDYNVPKVEIWKECLRVLKPGGHIIVACGTRTQHRMAVNIEDAGFEIRDIISWLYGSGFPKSLNVGKAVDKLESNSDWEGWGTSLKPAQELWTLARKPLSEKTVVANVLKWGVGGINIDGCRVKINPLIDDKRLGGKGDWSSDKMAKNVYEGGYTGERVGSSEKGRFPANVIHDGSDEVVREFPNTKSGLRKKSDNVGRDDGYLHNHGRFGERKAIPAETYGDEGSASRFFYCAKASKSERNEGLDGLEEKDIGHNRFDKCSNCGGYILQNPERPSACKCENPKRENNIVKGNFHPTVKPVKLIRYLCRLITPPEGWVLDPYLGSGTTGVACRLEGFNMIGFELSEEYEPIIKGRLNVKQKGLGDF